MDLGLDSIGKARPKTHTHCRSQKPDAADTERQGIERCIWQPNYTWVEVDGWWWATIAGRWTCCPRCDRPFTHREFCYGSVGMCATCRPDLLPPLERKRPKKKATDR